jgi:hypothetical protein
MDMDVGKHGSREAQSARGCCHCCCGCLYPALCRVTFNAFSRCGGFATTGKGERRGKRDKERQRERETETRKRKDEKESEIKD